MNRSLELNDLKIVNGKISLADLILGEFRGGQA